jgi:diapolycopene oxygenase
MNVGVIGSGLAGLAAACTLAARGHQVEVFEKNPWLGGKAAQLCAEGFRFDMGPTILIQPSVLRRIFSEAGRSLEDYIPMVRLDPQWRCFFEDGTRLDLRDDTAGMEAALEAIWPSMGKGYIKFLEQSKQLHSISERFFFWRSIGSMRDTMDIKGAFDIKVLRDVMRMRLGKSVAQVIRENIPDPNVAQMLDHFVQYVGSSPDASPAILCAIGHMQMEEGIWYPKGGTRAVPEGLAKLASDLGVRFHPSTDVLRVLTEDNGRGAKAGHVTGLLTTNEAGEQQTRRFDAVVSNSDAIRTYRELVGGAAGRHFDHARDYEAACSGVVLYLGLNKRYEHLAHHDFVFSRDPHEEFHAIYDQGEPAPDPTCYLAATSASDPTSAPEGGEALYCLVHTPYLRPHHNWKTMFPAYRQIILDKLKRTAGLTDIEDRIVYESHLTPQDIHDRYRVLNGAIYGISSHGMFNGAFKPANRSKELPGLYLAGGAAHPGPGMPMVMMSGWIAADSLDADSRNSDSRLARQNDGPSKQAVA